MKTWCSTCEVERNVNSVDRSVSNWTCECGTFLTAIVKDSASGERRPAAKRAPLARGRSSKPVMRPEVRAAMVEWARGGVCAVCGREDCQPVLGHHVLEQQWLISRARTLRIDPVPLLEDPRGWLRAGEPCHMGHHYTPGKRIPLLVLVEHCPDVFVFAAEYGLSERLNRTYPDVPAEAAA